MNRRLLALLIAVLVTLGACSSDDREESDPIRGTADSDPAPTVPTPTTTPPVASSSSTTAPDTTFIPTTTIPAETTAPATTAGPTTGSVPTTERVALVVDGRRREFTLYVPSRPEIPSSLVLDFHGLTATPDRQEQVSAMRRKAGHRGFVVAQPDASLVAGAWDTLEGSADVAFAIAIVDHVSSRVDIDPSRVFATGFSAGGGMAARLGCDASDVVAAVGVVAGAHVGWKRCSPTRPVPMIAFYGDADFVVPYGGFGLLPDVTEWTALWASINDCNADPADTRPAADVTMTTWSGCSASAQVRLYTIEGGGHGWPGTPDPSRLGDTTDSISATDLMWEFFELRAES